MDETVESETGSGSVTTSSDLASPAKVVSRLCVILADYMCVQLSWKGKEEYLYSAFLAKVVHSKRSGMDHTVVPANNTMPAFPS